MQIEHAQYRINGHQLRIERTGHNLVDLVTQQDGLDCYGELNLADTDAVWACVRHMFKEFNGYEGTEGDVTPIYNAIMAFAG